MLNGSGKGDCSATVPDCLCWDAYQDPVRVACPVVVGWEVNVNLVPARIDGGI